MKLFVIEKKIIKINLKINKIQKQFDQMLKHPVVMKEVRVGQLNETAVLQLIVWKEIVLEKQKKNKIHLRKYKSY